MEPAHVPEVSSDEDEWQAFDPLEGYQLLLDLGGGDRSPDSVTEASLADLHNSCSSDDSELAAGSSSEEGGRPAAAEGGSAASGRRRQPLLQAAQPGEPAGNSDNSFGEGSASVWALQGQGLEAGGRPSSSTAAPGVATSSVSPGGSAAPPAAAPAAAAAAAPSSPAAGAAGPDSPAAAATPPAAPTAALSEEQRGQILAAMRGIQLSYRPPWADIVPEESWMQRLREDGRSGGGSA